LSDRGICCGEGREKDRREAKDKKESEIAKHQRRKNGGSKEASAEK
jgi:hypothetical protein